jgi:hypothetical protein
MMRLGFQKSMNITGFQRYLYPVSNKLMEVHLYSQQSGITGTVLQVLRGWLGE